MLPTNIDLNDVDTSRPVLIDGKYPCTIKEVSVKPNKAQTGHNLVVIFSLLEAGDSTAGTTIGAGYQLRRYMPLQQSENPDAPDFKVDIARLLDAAFQTTQEDRPPLSDETIAALHGREVLVSVKVTESEEYGTGNDVRGVLSLG